jgi:hypothetical protein
LKKYLALLLLSVTLSWAQDGFDGHKALSYVEELCRPKFSGRKTGLPGARQAARWIGEQYQSWGLEPGGDNKSYIQEFPMLVTDQKKRAQFKLLNGSFGSVEYQEGVDFVVYFNSGSGRVTAEVVFVGYGICEPEKGWDDYAGVDVTGKLVLIYRGVPQDERDWSFANERFYKVRTAAKKGAAGLLMLDRGDWPTRGVTVNGEGYQPSMPLFNISKKIARDLFVGTHKNIDLVIRDLEKKTQSLALAKRVSLSVNMRLLPSQNGENVVAIWRGTDPVLQNEYIVLGGHMDHNGVSADGHLYAGADDDASGTAIVMELARVFAGKTRPKRSIVFAGFGGEEQGLLGSWYFAHHPTVPAEQIVAMFNFDMEGAGDGGASVSGRNYFMNPVDGVYKAYPDSIVKKFSMRRGSGMAGSDHSFFVQQGIPAFYFFSTGDHPFYHQFEDDPATLNMASLQFVGDRALDLVQAMADHPSSLQFHGHRSGRFFYLFGDQIDFSGQPFHALQNSDSLVLKTQPAAVRCVVWPLRVAQQLFNDLDRVEELIRSGKDKTLLRFKNSATLDAAAGESKLAVAVALEGTASLNKNAVLARMLCRAGVNWLTIRDREDPILSSGQLTDWGKDFLKVLGEENGILDCAVSDTTAIRAISKALKGKMFLRVKYHQIDGLGKFLADIGNKKSCLVILEATPDQIPDKVWALWGQMKPGSLHLTMLNSLLISDELKYQWLQKMYEARLATVGQEAAYKHMTSLLGESLKNFIGR